MEQSFQTNNHNQINIVLKKNDNHIKIAPAMKKETLKIDQTIEIKKEQHITLKVIEEEMGKLVGMDHVKKIAIEIYAWIYMNRIRQQHGLKTGPQALHMLFRGNPGTGKTTVAKILGKLFQEMEVLSKGHLIEAERADLVGEYIGHTAQKTRDLVKKALGGILFIDEAYSLARGGEKDFGKEAIDTLVNHMEQARDDFVLILAGYPREMDHFLSLNPGLKSRFPFIIDFPDYTVDQLVEIAKRMFSERQYQMTVEAEWKLRNHLQIIKDTPSFDSFSNGRYVRNIVEKAVRLQALRLLYENAHSRKELMSIKQYDLKF